MKNKDTSSDYKYMISELIQDCYNTYDFVSCIYSSDALLEINKTIDNIRKKYGNIISILTTIYKFDIEDLSSWSSSFNAFIKSNQKGLNSVRSSVYLTTVSRNFLNELVSHLHSYLDDLSNLCYKNFSLSKYRPEKNCVFIVHGHDIKLKTTLNKELKRNGFKPIVLSEKNDTGISLFDKFEKYANKCLKAIILMTKDDLVKKDEKEYYQPRPNVLIELGYFLNMLKREDVIIISEKGCKFPSDINGVSYLEYDSNLSILIRKVLSLLKEQS